MFRSAGWMRRYCERAGRGSAEHRRSGTWTSGDAVVFETLSGSTAGRDLVAGNAEYRATASVQRHVILEQTDTGASVFIRKGKEWISEMVSGNGTTLRSRKLVLGFP